MKNKMIAFLFLAVNASTLTGCFNNKPDYIQLDGMVVGNDGTTPIGNLPISEVDLNIHLKNGIILVKPITDGNITDAAGFFSLLTGDLNFSSKSSRTVCQWNCLSYYNGSCTSRYYSCRDVTDVDYYNLNNVDYVTTEIVIDLNPSSYLIVAGQSISQTLGQTVDGKALWEMSELYTTPFTASEELGGEAPAASPARRVITNEADLTAEEAAALAEINAKLAAAQ